MYAGIASRRHDSASVRLRGRPFHEATCCVQGVHSVCCPIFAQVCLWTCCSCDPPQSTRSCAQLLSSLVARKRFACQLAFYMWSADMAGVGLRTCFANARSRHGLAGAHAFDQRAFAGLRLVPLWVLFGSWPHRPRLPGRTPLTSSHMGKWWASSADAVWGLDVRPIHPDSVSSSRAAQRVRAMQPSRCHQRATSHARDEHESSTARPCGTCHPPARRLERLGGVQRDLRRQGHDVAVEDFPLNSIDILQLVHAQMMRFVGCFWGADFGEVLLRVDQPDRTNRPGVRRGGSTNFGRNWFHNARIWVKLGAAGTV